MIRFLLSSSRLLRRNQTTCKVYLLFSDFVKRTLHSYDKDIVLYKFSRPTFFRVIGLACVSQFVFWTYLGHFVYTELRSTWRVLPSKPSTEPGASDDVARSTNKSLASWKFRAGLASLSIGAGAALAMTGFLYASRTVSGLVLLRRNSGLRVVTYTPFGTQRSFIAPLESVKVIGSRNEKRVQIPMKIDGRPFYFLLDMEGTFLQPSIFDSAIGNKKHWQRP